MRPKHTKFNKYHSVKIKYSHKISKILNTAGLISLEPYIITDKQISTILLVLKRVLKRRGKIILRVFPHLSRTRKPIQTRMGKGKGNIEGFEQSIKAGSVIIEVKLNKDISYLLAKKGLESIQTKLPFRSKVIIK